MKHWIIIFIAAILFGGCCPESNYIEFDNQDKTIKVLSEDFYIKSVTITEYKQKDGYIELIDSNSLTLNQGGVRGAFVLNLLNSGENYQVSGVEYSKLMTLEHLHYKVRLAKFGNKKNGKDSDEGIIYFTNSEVKTSKTKFGSKHPCP